MRKLEQLGCSCCPPAISGGWRAYQRIVQTPMTLSIGLHDGLLGGSGSIGDPSIIVHDRVAGGNFVQEYNVKAKSFAPLFTLQDNYVRSEAIANYSGNNPTMTSQFATFSVTEVIPDASGETWTALIENSFLSGAFVIGGSGSIEFIVAKLDRNGNLSDWRYPQIPYEPDGERVGFRYAATMNSFHWNGQNVGASYCAPYHGQILRCDYEIKRVNRDGGGFFVVVDPSSVTYSPELPAATGWPGARSALYTPTFLALVDGKQLSWGNAYRSDWDTDYIPDTVPAAYNPNDPAEEWKYRPTLKVGDQDWPPTSYPGTIVPRYRGQRKNAACDWAAAMEVGIDSDLAAYNCMVNPWTSKTLLVFDSYLRVDQDDTVHPTLTSWPLPAAGYQSHNIWIPHFWEHQ